MVEVVNPGGVFVVVLVPLLCAMADLVFATVWWHTINSGATLAFFADGARPEPSFGVDARQMNNIALFEIVG